MKYINPDRKPYPFCPGCTHGTILDAVNDALEKTDADPKRTVLVSDIGCVGLADKYFDVHTFHGLHGRSFTYACGIKLANPELQVFVVVGDGGCGIGGHHLINAARRNIGIKVICFNNFNFGMTGGEHSVTTPNLGKTHTTPEGNIESPFDLCSLVLASNAAFVARKTAFDKDLSDTLAEAFRHDGFAFIDILELCSAYYMPLNEFKKPQMEKMIADSGLKLGILKAEKRTEYSKGLRLAWPSEKQAPKTPRGAEAKFKPDIKKGYYSIVLAGSAGMKIVSAATNLARAGLNCGLYATQQDDYPVTVQTGHSLSEVKLSPHPIHFAGIEEPDAVLVVSADGLRVAKKTLERLTEKDIVIKTKDVPVETKAKVYEIDMQDRSLGLSKANVMTAAICLLLHITKTMPPEALRSVIEAIPKEKIRDENMRALNAAEKIANEMSLQGA
jgi:pyruvate/2-oxoacid:ferredoxin oxidoreductase beta subunit/Pyruvate/2-oxoacid:ferredoxin oxidoreductase gamma subunit